MIGQQLGVYRLDERIGAGGMGEVYRARDTRLGRDVAIKILPQAFTTDADRLARFEREARLLASLNHSNIATIHSIEESGSLRGIVMELVPGATLAESLERGRMPVREALTLARQIADALETAHEQGIVHRDLKPANVKITSSGIVKVLDFGIAKTIPGGAATVMAQTPTITNDGTREGFIAGTAAYMSPEQARGFTVDKRTDIWAFGCVLFEMLTGRAPFARDTISDTIAAILEHDPTWDSLPADTPPSVAALLRRCLAKDPARRLRDIGDARLEIEECLASPIPVTMRGAGAPDRTSRRHRVLMSIGLPGAVLIGAAAALLWTRGNAPLEHPAQFTLSFAEQMPHMAATSVPVPSPDGRHFVFVGINDTGESSLWTRPLDSAAARRLTATDHAQSPIWSPDGRWIAFYADGKLKKVSVDGGQPQTIAALAGLQDAAWSSRGTIIFRPGNREPLFRISESGGMPAPLTQLDPALEENSHRGPTFLPDGRRFLFTSRCAAPENNALYIGSLDAPGVRRVTSLASKAVYVSPRARRPGMLLYYRDGGLEARPFDAERETFVGEPQPVIGGVDYVPASIIAGFQASADGRVIVVRPAGANDTQLTWFERSGEQAGTLGAPGSLLQPRISPRGDRVAFTRPDTRTGNRDIWTIDVGRGTAARLTLHPSNDWHAVWSPDGQRIVFGSDRGVQEGRMYMKQSLDATGEESQLLDSAGAPLDWSRDGRWIAVGANPPAVLPAGGRTPTPLLAGPFRQGGVRFSPDGKWIAYISDETGRIEVFVRPFSEGVAAAAGKIQVSNGGGDFPVWGSDGRELFYMGGDFHIYAVTTVDLHARRSVPAPERLFRACPGSVPQNAPMRGEWWAHPFDTRDGKRFLINCTARPPGELVVLMNWAPTEVR